MSNWAADEFRALPLEEIDVRYGRYRLAVLEAEEAMARSLRRYGQISPIVVWVRDDGLSQAEVAVLLGRHKSWVCRRLAMMEKLCPAAQEDLRLGLLSPTMARQLTWRAGRP